MSWRGETINRCFPTVWTGTKPDGSPSPDNCGGWSDPGVDDRGGIGDVGFVDPYWTSYGRTFCTAQPFPLYCFQQA